MRLLIINADDCNLTDGVTRGILKSHDEGILSSTTVLINLPLDERTVRELKKRKNLGLGVHLNVTLGGTLSRHSDVPSLLDPEGRFRRPPDYWKRLPSVHEVIREYQAQILFFEKRFGRIPDHVDTHHHLHDHPLFFQAVSSVAKKWKIPVRRSRIFQMSESRSLIEGLKTTDFLFGNLEARFHWQMPSFLGLIENLPEGTSEIGCHPGFCDTELRKISSLQEAREKELKLFSDKRLRRKLADLGVELGRFSKI